MKSKNTLLQNIRDHLDQSAEFLDSHTRSQITAARNKALDQGRPFHIKWGMPLSGIVAAAAAGYLAVSLFTGQQARQNSLPDPGQERIPIMAERSLAPDPIAPASDDPGIQISDGQPKAPSEPLRPDLQTVTTEIRGTPLKIKPDQLELLALLASDRTLEFYENIEFYTWLAENPLEIAGS